MAFRMGIGLLVGLMLFCSHCQIAAAPEVEPEEGASGAIWSEGEFVSPNGECRVELKRYPLGGFLVLTFKQGQTKSVNDVTGIAWASAETLVYTVSSIYSDQPGVYSYNCHSHRVKRLVAPIARNAAHPKDYFQMQSVTKSRPIIIYFYYAKAVDKESFTNSESRAHLYQVYVDGTGFQKANQPPK